MRLARQALLALPAQFAVAAVRRVEAATPSDLSLEYHDGRLAWPGGGARAAIGRAGVTPHKREGDGATPAGAFPLVSAFYRADRIVKPGSGLPLRALAPSDAWVDDPADPRYNRLVALPYMAHVEPMWLDEDVYDLLVVIGYNMAPTVPGAGSAIFLHIARPNFSPTAGCIAIEKDVLLRLLPQLGLASTITIHG